jgi:hypothetical protein
MLPSVDANNVLILEQGPLPMMVTCGGVAVAAGAWWVTENDPNMGVSHDQPLPDCCSVPWCLPRCCVTTYWV